MISVSKYNEIMKHIELTEEMRERIIGNIEAEQRRKRIRMTTGILTAAAACIVVVAGLTFMNGREQLPQPPGTTATSVTTVTTTDTAAPVVSEPDSVNPTDSSEPDITDTGDGSTPEASGFLAPEEFTSAEELSNAFGIEVHDIEMSFEVTERSYFLIPINKSIIDPCFIPRSPASLL